MLKQDLLTLIDSFIKETWKYDFSDELDRDMGHIYRLEHELKKSDDIDLVQIYNKLLSVIGMIKFKYGYESKIIDSNSDLKEKVSRTSLDNENLADEYTAIKEKYLDYVKNIANIDFISIQRNSDNEGLYLALESLKSLITNDKYKSHLNDSQIGEVLIDCVKLINGVSSLNRIESKYKELVQGIWKESLFYSKDNESFRVLFSNISGLLQDQAYNLINRPDQSSCSMISSNFIATYLGEYRRIGFIYPNDSNIIMASAFDLSSNVFSTGVKNKEKGTSLATPEVLERIGIERTKEKGEDLLSSSCYNEVLVDSKPCGIMVIGFGEENLNVDYEDAVNLANDLKLPLYTIDVMKYKKDLSEKDKEYIAYHSVLSYLGINNITMSMLARQNKAGDIFKIIDSKKETISQKFMELKEQGILNKENMLQSLSDIIDVNVPSNFTM